MARTGVTESAVFEAADALVARGERPTIERLRAALGTGSPNTLLRHLDAWWRGLAARLDAHARALAIPEAPAHVQAAATHLWTCALAVAQEGADHRHAAAHQTLEAERAALRERDAEIRASRDAAVAEAAAAETRLADLRRLADTQSDQVKDLQQQRDVATAALETLQRTLETTRHAAAERLSTALKEREAADIQYRATEARWMRETDRARQETAALQRQLEREKTGYARERAALSAEIKAVRNKLRMSERNRAARDAEMLKPRRAIDRLQSSRPTGKRRPSSSAAPKKTPAASR